MKLKDKVAIVTGAGQGIGEAYARRFAREGATVVVADINETNGHAVAEAIGSAAIFERVDVSNEADTVEASKMLMIEWLAAAAARCRMLACALPFALGLLWGVSSAGALCVGDCDDNGSVTIDELLTAVNIALGGVPLSACPNADPATDGTVTVDELVAAVNSALNGCPQSATPTPTATVTATPAELPPTSTVTPTPDTGDAIPTTANELLAWLQAGRYLGWTAESAPHRSTGPHGGTVRTYLNDIVLQSLTAGNVSHPAGSALVKELYYSGSTVQGWAVEVKIQQDSAGGMGWYWFEGVAFSGVGLPVCTGCHSAGRDYVLTPFPLQ